MGYKVAVVGATGNVGREILKVLSERAFPVDEVVALASRESVGKEISFGEDVTLTVRALALCCVGAAPALRMHRPCKKNRRLRGQGRCPIWRFAECNECNGCTECNECPPGHPGV